MASILGPDGTARPTSAAGVGHTPAPAAARAGDTGFAEHYRRLAGHMPHPVAVLAVSRRGLRHAVTVDSFLDVSYDPPTMAVSVYGGARIAESLAVVDSFSLSVLTSGQKGTAQWLGEPGQPLRGPLDTVATWTAPSGAPVIADCAAWFDLSIVSRIEVATHDLVVGEVTAAGPPAAPPLPPLVHWADGYAEPAPR